MIILFMLKSMILLFLFLRSLRQTVYLVHPEKWLPAILSSVANKILNVNTLIYLYFIGSHDAFASWWHFHVPHVDQKNALNLVSLVETECVSETNVLYFQSFMHFSGSTT